MLFINNHIFLSLSLTLSKFTALVFFFVVGVVLVIQMHFFFNLLSL